MLTQFNANRGVATTQNYSNVSLPITPTIPYPVKQGSSALADQQAAFQEQLNQIAAEMDRRNNSFYGLGAALVDHEETQGWFSRLKRVITGGTALHDAVWAKNETAVKYFINETTVNQLNRSGKTPLYLAVQNGWMEGAKLLRRYGATLAFSPEILSSEEMLSFLLDEKLIDINAIYNKGEEHETTLLFYAIAFDREKIVKILLARGADITFEIKDVNALVFATASTSAVKKEIDLFLSRRYKKDPDKTVSALANKYTTQFEAIIRQVLKSSDQVSVRIRENRFGQKYHNILIGEVEYDMYEIISAMNWQALRFDKKDFEILKHSPYFEAFKKLLGDLNQYAHLEDRMPDQKQKYANLTPFDKGIIYFYTDEMSYFINPFLKGEPLDHKGKEILSPSSLFVKPQRCDGIHCWLYSAFLANALNKISPTTTDQVFCRGQSERDRVLRENHPAFLSTSPSFTLCGMYANAAKGKIAVVSDVVAKDITALSYHPNEVEYLGLPVKMEADDSSHFIYKAKLKK